MAWVVAANATAKNLLPAGDWEGLKGFTDVDVALVDDTDEGAISFLVLDLFNPIPIPNPSQTLTLVRR